MERDLSLVDVESVGMKIQLPEVPLRVAEAKRMRRSEVIRLETSSPDEPQAAEMVPARFRLRELFHRQARSS